MNHHRRSIRLPEYDYSQEGCYFVTIVTKHRTPIFGEIIDGEMHLSIYEKIVESTWHDLKNHNSNIDLDEFIIMRNHIHGIIYLFAVGAGSQLARNLQPIHDWAGHGPAPTFDKRVPLSEIVRQFKTFSAKRINLIQNTPGVPVWQRNYYEHIIGKDQEYKSIATYIAENPMYWQTDTENNSP